MCVCVCVCGTTIKCDFYAIYFNEKNRYFIFAYLNRFPRERKKIRWKQKLLNVHKNVQKNQKNRTIISECTYIMRQKQMI